jgi:hypothetical protein
MSLSGKYSIGEPLQYGSIYHSQKWRFPVKDEGGQVVGWCKQEKVVDENGEESGVTYYTRDLPKPYGAKRFYSSPQALVIACGGAIDRTMPNPLPAVKNSPAFDPVLSDVTGEVEKEPEVAEDVGGEIPAAEPVLDKADLAVLDMVKPGKLAKKAIVDLGVIKSKALSERALKGAATKAANKLKQLKQEKAAARALAKKKKLRAAKRVAKKYGSI